VLSNGKRCPNAALPGSKYCGVPAHQALAGQQADDEANPVVAEAEPELEALSDRAEPEAVTEDVEQLGAAEPEEEPLENGGALPQRVEDDPNAGIPVEAEGARGNE
jgi:N utilization substance protein A